MDQLVENQLFLVDVRVGCETVVLEIVILLLENKLVHIVELYFAGQVIFLFFFALDRRNLKLLLFA